MNVRKQYVATVKPERRDDITDEKIRNFLKSLTDVRVVFETEGEFVFEATEGTFTLVEKALKKWCTVLLDGQVDYDF